jgi:hypothetical protein
VTGGTVATGWDGSTDFSTDFGHRGETEFYTTSWSRMFCAIDTVNHDGKDFTLPAGLNYWWSLNNGDFSKDPNAIVSYVAGGMAGNAGPVATDCAGDLRQSTMTTDVSAILFYPFTIPAGIGSDLTSSYNGQNGEFDSPSNMLIDMAELQVFSGTLLDTSDPANIALFVTVEGGIASPTPMSVAAGALGRPVIAISGQANWIAGNNAGSAGNFTPFATISPFSPDPSF